MIASAANPEALRGPQFDCAWSDEDCMAPSHGACQIDAQPRAELAQARRQFGGRDRDGAGHIAPSRRIVSS